MLDTLETAPRMQVREFSTLNYANGMTTYCLTTTGYLEPTGHTREDVLTAGYFESVRGLLAPGDWIFVSASDGPLILWARGNEIGVTVERVR